MEMCTSFPPVVDAGSRVLVLGSMPGVASLRAQQYYAHPRNAFWPILFGLWGEPVAEDYAARVAFAHARRIAIWDVAQTCLRHASSDASVRDAQANDLAGLLAAHPGIVAIFHNGRLSQQLFDRLCKNAAEARPRVLLPSTSPAYTMPFDEKLSAWQMVRRAIEEE